MKKVILIGIFCFNVVLINAQDGIQHDAEHYILLSQHQDKWAAEDKDIDDKLKKIQNENHGKRPNIIYILIDDVGFGEFGDPLLNKVRGYETPSINKFAEESMSFSRMYSRACLLAGCIQNHHALQQELHF